MSDIDAVAEGLWWMEEHMLSADREKVKAAHEALSRVEDALLGLTTGHEAKCQCAGCVVLRGGG